MATVDIELYYDLDRRRWTTSAGGLATQPSLFIGQSNTIDFKVRFVQGGVPIELTNPSFIAGVKVTDDPLGDYLLLTTTGTKTGAGATTIYTFTLLIDSVELQAYLVGITPTTNSTAFEVRDTVNNIATLPAITCSILPDYTLTGATPAAASGTLVVDSGATFTVHKTFAMPVDDGSPNWVLQTNGSGVGSWVAQNAGLTDGDKGDITVSASGATWTIDAGVVTLAKMANMATSRVIGRTTAGTGVPELLTISGTGNVVMTTSTDAQTFSSAIPSTSTGSGAVVISTGGLGVGGSAYIGGLINLPATTSTAGQITQAGTRLLHTYGTSNVFVGAGAGNFGTSGAGANVGIGRISLSNLTLGVQNACIGDQSGVSITTGSTNMLMGYNAGNLINTGSANCAVGVNSLTQVTSTSNNVAIGYQALGSTTGSSSTGIGHNAGYYATGGSGTYIGQGAGIATSTIGGLVGVAITSGTNCTMLGQGSGSTSATGNYRTAIGSDSRCESNNAIKLGRDTLDVVILPKMTQAQMATAATTLSTVKGALVYCTDGGTDADHIHYYNGSVWTRLN